MHSKFIFFLALSLMLLPACGTLKQSSEEEQRVANLVNQQLDERNYLITIDYMMPLRGRSHMVSGSYSIEIDDTVIDSHLPYVGVATSVPYGGGNVLTFKEEIEKYEDKGWKKGLRTIVLSTNNGEETLVYTLTISDSGSASVDVHCLRRDDIRYRGNLVITEDESQ